MKLLTGRCLGLLALAAVASGQQSVPQAEPTVVTVTGQATPLSAADASVTLVTRRDIEQSHAASLADLLRQAPFLFLTQSGGAGGMTTVTLRGGKPNFTLVMIDGVPVNDITNTLGGSFDFSAMSTDNIEQVEIVRGPLSAVYGSDAVAGVINIISRQGENGTRVEASAAYGNFNDREFQAATSGKIRNFHYSFGGSYQANGIQVESDPFRLGTAAFHARWALGSGQLITISLRYQDSQQAGFPSNGGGPEYSIARQPQSVHTRAVVAGIGWQKQAGSRWLLSAGLDLFDNAADSSIPAILDAPKPTFRSVPSEATDTSFRRVRANVSASVTLASGWTATFTGSWRGEHGETAGLLAGNIPDSFAITRNTGGGAAALSYRRGHLSATLGLHADKTPGFDAVFSPRAGVAWQVGDRGPRLKSSWGRGFKLPSFYSMADPVVGNRNLKPEYSSSFEGGLEQGFAGDRARAGLTLFRNDYRDLVDFDSQLFRLVNRSEVHTHGAEFALTVAAGQSLEFRSSLSYLAWSLSQTTQPLRDQPHWQSGAGATWKPSRRFQARFDSLWVGRRYDFSVPRPDQATAGGYSTTSAAADYEISRSVTAFVRSDNLFNARYHEFIGFPSPGIAVHAGLAFRLRY